MAEKNNLKEEVVSIHRTQTLEEGEITYNVDHLQRHLGNRQIQLIAIGGSIGTALFVRSVLFDAK